MPLYEYQCDPYGHRFEVIQKSSDDPITVCPQCGGTVQKLLSSPAIQFKGSGWYITDYARAGKSDSANAGSGKNDSGAPSSDHTSASAKADGKAESKSDRKSEGTSEGTAESKGDRKAEGTSDRNAESKSDRKAESKPSASPKSD